MLHSFVCVHAFPPRHEKNVIYKVLNKPNLPLSEQRKQIKYNCGEEGLRKSNDGKSLHLTQLPPLLRPWLLPAASVCPPPATLAVSTTLETFPLIPSFTALVETSRLTSKSTRTHPIESAALSDIIKMAHVQREEQVGFTNTHAKAKYGLNCTLPAQSVHCVALLQVPNLSLLHA